MSGCQEQGVGGALTIKGYKGNLGDDGTVLYLDCGDGYMAICIFQNS